VTGIAERVHDEARCHAWRAMLLENEIMELGSVMAAAIDGGGVPRAAMARADELLFEARRWLDRGELDGAEGWLRSAELEIIAQKRGFKDCASNG
jgi:hypothetical protein